VNKYKEMLTQIVEYENYSHDYEDINVYNGSHTIRCHYCYFSTWSSKHAEMLVPENHDDDCLWKQAKELLSDN